MKNLPGGLWPVMLTPFTGSDAIDVPGLEGLVDFYIQSGSRGLFANCLSGEMFELTEDERITITRITVKRANKKVPVISSGTFSKDERVNIDFIKRIYDTGVDAVIIISNQLIEESEPEEKFKLKLESLMAGTDEIPLGVYECPVPHKRLLSPEILKWMSQSGRFFYLKDTSCEESLIIDKLAAIRDSSFGLYNAHIPTSLSSLRAGAKGISPIGANYFPEAYAFLADHFDTPEMQDRIEKLNSQLCLIDPRLHLYYPYSAKWFLRERGLDISTHTRTDYQVMKKSDYSDLKNLLKIFHDLAEELISG